MGVKIIGGASDSLAEVGSVNKALRVTAFPYDYGVLGSYKMGHASAIMAAGLSSASPILSFRNSSANLAVIRRVTFSMAGLATAFTAGQALFNLFAARSFSASDTGGGALTQTTNNGKLRTSMATTGIAEIRGSSTAALSAGTRVKDATPLAVLTVGLGVVVSTIYIPPQTVFLGGDTDGHPLVLAQNEGFVIEATVPATGTWVFGCNIDWSEMAAF